MAKKSTAIATREDDQVPAHLRQYQGGRGLSKDQADNIVPIIRILQALSPQVQKRNPAYIDGANPGDLLLRNAVEPIVNGEEGIYFQPCYFRKDWVEWVPRDAGGGMAGRHAHLPATAKQVEDDKGRNIPKYVQPNGNELKETRYHFGYVLGHGKPMPFVIPMSGSGHAISKALMTLLNMKGGDLDSFVHVLHLKTRPTANAMGEWYTWDITWDRYATEKECEEGVKLFDALAAGQKVAEDLDQEDDITSSRI